jgi:multiple sugar transport system ATP-binding protein
MIYVTHDQVEAMTLGQRIVVMNQGVIQQIDAPMRIYARPANLFVAGFLGNPAMNLWRGQVHETSGMPQLTNGADALQLTSAMPYPETAGDIVIGVRPENVHRISPNDPAYEIRFDATVDLVEAVGNEAFIHARCGAWPVVVRALPDELPPVGSTLTLGVAPSHLHVFDATTGARIG